MRYLTQVVNDPRQLVWRVKEAEKLKNDIALASTPPGLSGW